MSVQKYLQLPTMIDHFKLQTLYLPENYDKVQIETNDVNRPGLQLTGFFDHFDRTRVQIFGRVESTYLMSISEQSRYESLRGLFASEPVCIVITRDIEPYPEMLTFAQEYNIPLLKTKEKTSQFVSRLVDLLDQTFAPVIVRHGVLVEVYGEGVLITGESGVGKSETAIELVKRGHRLIADDAVEIKRIGERALVGSSPELIRHFIEIRGIGIVDVKHIFGIGAVKDSSNIDLMIHLEAWDDEKSYDRLGMSDVYTDILDTQVPSLAVPVKPGRNLAVIIEIAAMNNRQKRMGYNAAVELNNRILAQMQGNEEK